MTPTVEPTAGAMPTSRALDPALRRGRGGRRHLWFIALGRDRGFNELAISGTRRLVDSHPRGISRDQSSLVIRLRQRQTHEPLLPLTGRQQRDRTQPNVKRTTVHCGIPSHGQDTTRIQRLTRIEPHDPRVVGNMAAHIVLPWSHRAFSLLKRWAMGTYQPEPR